MLAGLILAIGAGTAFVAPALGPGSVASTARYAASEQQLFAAAASSGRWGCARAAVNMNSVMGDPKLKGYKVGDRAPDGAIRSGTTTGEQKQWNLDNLTNLFKPAEEKKTAGKKSTKSRVKRI